MATLDLSGAKASFDMTLAYLVDLVTAYEAQPTHWLFTKPLGHAVRLYGGGLTHDAAGRALTGTADAINFDLGDDGPVYPDVWIGGTAANATRATPRGPRHPAA